ncbi:TonB-dependent receptor plug domain-containing protein [Alteriqipengyuania sp.]|uniref:TonB-dependent receptor plug domain-containing protein n=1 Tax=Alteriqipengyuania sp. TaxID=2800692 RepID=UPI0035160BEE
MQFSRRFTAACLASAAFTTPVIAQDDAATTSTAPETSVAAIENGQVYQPAFFQRFAPQTALDMVGQVPGFGITGQSDARGLGQGGANVLLNGTRFSGKSVSITDALGRIPAADVVRIELLDGASLNIPGLSGQVVNVVYESGGGGGQFRWSPQFRSSGTDPLLTNGEISWSATSGRVDYTVSLQNTSAHQGNEGPGFRYDGNGDLVETRYENLFIERERPKLSGTIKYSGAGGDVGNLSGAFQLYRLDYLELRDGNLGTRKLVQKEDEYNYEIGGDYAFDLGSGRLKLIGLRRFEASDFQNTVRSTYADQSPDTGSLQDLYIDETESILRTEYAWKAGANDWQISLEGALNSLATANEVQRLDPTTGGHVPAFASPETVVEEKRAEAAITWGRQLAANLSLQASIGGEYSELSQSGQRGKMRSFWRPKGFVSAAWKATPDLDLRLKVSRAVGQLNFFDFVASTDLGSGNNQAGNPDLVPEQSWDIELEATKTLGPWGSLTITGIHRAISDRVTQIPIGATDEAPGNVDRATINFLRARGTFKLDPIGWRGAQIDLTTFIRETSVYDPLDGIYRPFSGSQRRLLDASLRHDVPASDWAYGGGIYAYDSEPGVRLNQVSQRSLDGADGYVYVEHKDVAGLKLRATVGNLLNAGDVFSRTVFVNRRGGPVAFSEAEDRTYGTIFTFDISGSFG